MAIASAEMRRTELCTTVKIRHTTVENGLKTGRAASFQRSTKVNKKWKTFRNKPKLEQSNERSTHWQTQGEDREKKACVRTKTGPKLESSQAQRM